MLEHIINNNLECKYPKEILTTRIVKKLNYPTLQKEKT